MTRKLPLASTIIVLAAFGTMVALGVWQLQRLQWKEALLEQYNAALSMSSDVDWAGHADDPEAVLYRHATAVCDRVIALNPEAGHNATGETGWAQVARCAIAGVGEADVVLGWSRNPETIRWSGGAVAGVLGPGRAGAVRLVVDPPLAGLEANARPDPNDVPNNHLSYAIQWFFFALTALVIYALALRKRWRGE